MKGVVGLVLALSVFGVAGVAAADHAGTGVIVAAGAADPTLTLILEDGQRWTLILAESTEAYDDLGRAIPAARLGQGDYVREVCTKLPHGRVVARQITRLRPAWRALESPEY